MKKAIIAIGIFLVIQNQVKSQAVAYSDPAKAFNKMMLDKNSEGGTLDRVGTYKVRGTSYYFGGGLPATVYTKKDGVLKDMVIDYNTFNQLLQIYFNTNKPAGTKKVTEVDSFQVKVSTTDYKADVIFISTAILDSTENFFLQRIVGGSKYSLYKRYKSDLGYVSDNILESDLRQYDLNIDYYYTVAGTKGIKKIKMTNNGIVKEFKKIKDISAIVDNGSLVFDQEDVLVKVFAELNK